MLYWMQTEAPRLDGGTGYSGLRLRPDVVGTSDGLARQVYVRESRRIKAEFTVLEQHVGVEARGVRGAQAFHDSVGIGAYRIDLHPGTAGRSYVDVSSWPFQIPLGALIPVRVENLLPACKNLGTTHITNGCYRLHPVEWNIGEASGALAAYCLDKDLVPRQGAKMWKTWRTFSACWLTSSASNWPGLNRNATSPFEEHLLPCRIPPRDPQSEWSVPLAERNSSLIPIPRPEYPRPQFRRKDWTNPERRVELRLRRSTDTGLANGWQKCHPRGPAIRKLAVRPQDHHSLLLPIEALRHRRDSLPRRRLVHPLLRVSFSRATSGYSSISALWTTARRSGLTARR